MLASVLSQLGINETLWTQFAIFVAFFFIAKFIFFKPFLDLVKLREAKTSGVESNAGDLAQKTEAKEEEYLQKVLEARRKAKEIRDAIVRESKAAAAKKVSEARDAAKAKVEAGRKEIESEAKVTMTELDANVPNISKLFVDKVLHPKAGI